MTTATAEPAAATATPAPSTAPAAAAPAPTPAPAPAAAAPSPAPAPSLMSKGATAAPAPAEGAPAPALAAEDPHGWLAQKYRVMKADGSLDVEASARKVAEAHSHLERRMGAGDAPPKDPESYQITPPDGVTVDALKADPMFSGFLKSAHAKGMTNAQVSFVLSEFVSRQQLAASPQVAEQELRKVWADDQQFQQGLSNAYRAAKAFAGSDEALARLDKKFGNDPDYLQVMARIGRELAEDSPPTGALPPNEQASLESLMKSEAYFSAKHPDHDRVVGQVRALYAKKYGTK